MDSDRLSRKTLAAYAGPAAPIAAMGLPLFVYIPPFYAREIGLGLGVVGTVFMISRFWDVITDPILGVVSDTFESRYGRRRHWILLAVPIILVAAYQIFMPPGMLTGPVSGWYLLSWLVILYVGWTLLTISHVSWGAELSPDYNERSRIQGWRQCTLIAGMITVLVLPAIIEQTEVANRASQRIASMGWYVLILLPLTVAAAVYFVPERPQPESEASNEWREALRVILRNEGLLRVLGADLAGGLAMGFVSVMFMFLAEDVLKLDAWASALLLVYFVAGLSFIPVVLRISYRFGKHKTVAAVGIAKAAGLPVILILPSERVLLTFVCWAVYGLTMGAVPFLMRSMMADVVDDDNLRSGSARTGSLYSMLTMTNKIGRALSVGVSYWALDLIGFVPGGTNDPTTLFHFRLLYVVPPVLLNLVLVYAVWNFPINLQRQKELRRALHDRGREDGEKTTATDRDDTHEPSLRPLTTEE